MSKEGVKQSQEYRKPRKRIKLEEREGVVGKECRNCEVWKPLTDYYKCKKSVGGAQAKCKKCAYEIQVAYYQENKDRILERNRTYYQENKDSISKVNKQWKEVNKEKVAKYQLEYKRRNPNIDKEYYLKNKQEVSRYRKQWSQNNADKMRFYRRKYDESNPDVRRLIVNRRRARKLALPDDFSILQKEQSIMLFEGCALTGSSDFTWDHAIPLAVGQEGTTQGNMYPLRGDLNSSKQNKNIFEWFEANRQRFELSQDRFDKLIEYLASANAMTIEEYRNHVYWCHANPRNINELEAN